jgi:hypothetical protein
MKAAHLIILPLCALVFVLFLYWLALQNTPPVQLKKTPIAIAQLEIIDPGDGRRLESILDRRQPAGAALNGDTDSSAGDMSAGLPPRSDTPLIKAAMYNRKPFIAEQNLFLPSDRIYLVMDLYNLEAGSHQLSAAWVNPEGKTINTAEHTISLNAPEQQHRSYFWLELMKNGPFTELFTGSEYKGSAYGRWQVDIRLNGRSAGKLNFTIQDG